MSSKKAAPQPVDKLQDPRDLEDIDYDAIRDNEDGDEPAEELSLKESDFAAPKATVDVLEAVNRVVTLALKKPLGGPLVASQLLSYCTVTVEELEAVEKSKQ